MEEAQLETKAILANLQKGHEALIIEATNKAAKPMNFAWDGAAMQQLKQMSENQTAFPVHDVTVKTSPFKPTSGGSPINTLKEYSSASVWKTESGANYLPSPGNDNCQVPAGFHSKATIDMPTNFAWKRLDASKEEEPAPTGKFILYAAPGNINFPTFAISNLVFLLVLVSLYLFPTNNDDYSNRRTC